MSKFYFTYGCEDENQAMNGGWTEVIAESREQAVDAFLAVHPSKNGFVPCAFIYNAEDFEKTRAFKNGNFGMFCRETINFNVTKEDGTDV